MRILIDILHPAHVHVFRNLAADMSARGHEVQFTLREKDRTGALMKDYGLDYVLLSHKRTGWGLVAEYLQRTARLAAVVGRYRPHFMLGVMGPSIAAVGRMRRWLARDRVRTLILYGTEAAKITNWFAYPMADYVCTPDSYQRQVMGNHMTFPSYLSMAYLAPKRFTPDPKVVASAGLDVGRPFFIVRFVSYEASHDIGVQGVALEKKIALIDMLAQRGRVLISSEQPLPPVLRAYRLDAPISHIHHFLRYATALVGESATMASECAVLGTPAFYISPIGRGFTDEQESRYGLVTNITGSRVAGDWVETVRAALDDARLADRAREGHARLLADKIDLTDWLAALLEREYGRHFAAT